jgi:hypothetical protein
MDGRTLRRYRSVGTLVVVRLIKFNTLTAGRNLLLALRTAAGSKKQESTPASNSRIEAL